MLKGSFPGWWRESGAVHGDENNISHVNSVPGPGQCRWQPHRGH